LGYSSTSPSPEQAARSPLPRPASPRHQTTPSSPSFPGGGAARHALRRRRAPTRYTRPYSSLACCAEWRTPKLSYNPFVLRSGSIASPVLGPRPDCQFYGLIIMHCNRTAIVTSFLAYDRGFTYCIEPTGFGEYPQRFCRLTKTGSKLGTLVTKKLYRY
jgi:hypothetical protein